MILSKRDLQWLRCTDILLRLLIMASVISLSSLCRSFISGNVRQYLSQLLLSLPKREVVCLLGLLSPLDLVEFENRLSNVSSSSVELTSRDMNKYVCVCMHMLELVLLRMTCTCVHLILFQDMGMCL